MFSKVHKVAKQVNNVIIGKEQQIRQALVCLLAGGHLLIEDLPGVGKTTLAHALAISLGLKFNRLQFTSDLLPADVVGISIFDREKSQFVFHPGPIFAQVLLADGNQPCDTQDAIIFARGHGRKTSFGRGTNPQPAEAFLCHRDPKSGTSGRYFCFA